MNNIRCAILAGALAFVFVPLSARAAVLSVSPATATLAEGSDVSISVMVDSEGVAINNAEGTISFPRDMFDVVSINKDVSLFNLWIQVPTYDGNSSVSFNGGLPSPGYQGSNGRLFVVTLRAKGEGTATVSLLNGAVRANDGLGTDLLRTTQGATIVISDAIKSPTPNVTPAVPTPTSSGKSPLAISSVTHPSQDVWYSNSNVVLSWSLPANTDAIQTLLSKTRGATPVVLYRPPVLRKTLEPLEDGVWYFNIRPHTSSGWGEIQSYRLQIDTTVPALRSLLTYDTGSRSLYVQASAEDTGSGVQMYQILIDNKVAATIPPEKLSSGFYRLSIDPPVGDHVASIRVLDAAGNQTASEQTGFTVIEKNTLLTTLVSIIVSFDYGSLLLPLALVISFASLSFNIVLWKKLKHMRRLTQSDRLTHRVTRRKKED